ncbi:type II secretion system protein GspG [Hyalangium rubrum]|uniref:Type II secretion system protein GspG n=1 Tax=Hyalangium rubrum TaxID=3103134 RepID=A0ABU5GW71_9BACT|nr:type II secretion system protein GspG [Hyalangium sp. s54d21]MDY7225443.1 type II secretion system protein GspG [Hyalangium sp. s54d21]
MAEHVTTPQNPDMAPRPARMGRLVVGAVVALATVLAFVMVQLTNDETLGEKQRQARAEIRKLDGVFRAFYRLMGRYPTEQEGFGILVQARVLDKEPVDPWGHPYVYRFNDKRSGVLSYGADGVPGGQGDDADITSGGVEEARR